MGRLATDLTNLRFGRLTVLQRFRYGKQSSAQWVARCDCGKRTTIASRNLKSGRTQSCGCKRKEIARQHALTFLKDTNQNRVKHGMSSTDLYSVYMSMRQRCENPKAYGYRWYGHRGVKVLFPDFAAFAAEIDRIGGRPSVAHSLDRIDPSKHYEVGNLRYSTKAVQTRNRRPNRKQSEVEREELERRIAELTAHDVPVPV